MAAYMKVSGIEGEANEQNHKKWIAIQSMSAPVHRSIPSGAREQERQKGTTSLGDIVIVKSVDKSSVKLQGACALGKILSEVTIDFLTTVKDKEEVYLQYVLKNAIVTSYSFHGHESGSPLPTEELTLGFSEINWKYTSFDKAGNSAGSVEAKYNIEERTGTA